MKKTLVSTLVLILSTLTIFSAHARIHLGDAKRIALREEPGVIVEAGMWKEAAGHVYAFDIRKNNGSLVGIRINGDNGDIIEHAVKILPRGERPRDAAVPSQAAEHRARAHVDKWSKGSDKATSDGVYLTYYNHDRAYEVTVKKSDKQYTVYVDAMTGRVLLSREKS